MARKNVIVYFCDKTCVADIHDKKVKAKKFVYLVADGTTATLQFTDSPFDPPVTTVSIPRDTFVKMTMGSRKGAFPYTITCSCPTQPDDPSMIVE
jgi:hypothetical protein